MCDKCSGDIKNCNKETAVTETCVDGMTQCVSTVLHSESGINYFFGCADSLDCKAARASCAQIPEQNPGTSCNATCCDSDRCVRPHESDYDPQECYTCSSMEDCKMATMTRCSDEQKRCFKLTGDFKRQDINSMFYMKGCATIDQCKNMEKNVFYSACSDQAESCYMSCCEGDKCNAGSNAVVSTFTLLLCAIVAAVRLR